MKTYLTELSPRELQTAVLVAQDMSDCEIARQMKISVQTVHSHIKAIYRHTHAASRMGIAFLVVREGLITMDALVAIDGSASGTAQDGLSVRMVRLTTSINRWGR